MGRKMGSFEQSFTWIAVMLLGMGVLFLAVGVAVGFFVDITPESMTTYRNGVLVPSDENSVRSFKLLFLGIFGGFGVVIFIVGLVLALRARSKTQKRARLREEGAEIWAAVTGVVHTGAWVNRRPLFCLQCSYTDPGGTTYIFKSASLRMDPTYSLNSGQVKVYFDRGDITNYFVDVNGSLGSGDIVVL